MNTPIAADNRSNIVIIDDTPANLQVLTEMLQQQNYWVRPFPGGKLALGAIKKNPPDLILLDISMPEMNGYEVCALFKSDPLLESIPVIFISALNETIDKLRAFEVGGVDYITKPFQFEEVQARVETHLELQRQRHELQKNCDLMERQRTLLLKSNTELRELQEFRDNMAHILVHDLRQPMTGVMGYLDLIELQDGEKLSGASRGTISKIRASSHRLIEMINSILDVSKMEAGKLQLAKASCDPVALAREALAYVEPLRRNRSLELLAPDGLPQITVDPVLIVRVIENLLGNAMKFSPADGWIVVKIELDGSSIRIIVSDSGPGIPPEFHSSIFEKFNQIQAGPRSMGTGLGLCFCKLEVEAHGGRIGVESEAGKGCAFWFTLPVR